MKHALLLAFALTSTALAAETPLPTVNGDDVDCKAIYAQQDLLTKAQEALQRGKDLDTLDDDAQELARLSKQDLEALDKETSSAAMACGFMSSGAVYASSYYCASVRDPAWKRLCYAYMAPVANDCDNTGRLRLSCDKARKGALKVTAESFEDFLKRTRSRKPNCGANASDEFAEAYCSALKRKDGRACDRTFGSSTDEHELCEIIADRPSGDDAKAKQLADCKVSATRVDGIGMSYAVEWCETWLD